MNRTIVRTVLVTSLAALAACKDQGSSAAAGATAPGPLPASPSTGSSAAPRSGYREKPVTDGHAIEVHVKFTGAKEAPRQTSWSIPPMVRSQCGGAEAAVNASLSVAPNLGVDEVVVWIDDIHEGAPLSSTTPRQSAMVDEKGCAFVPHVTAMPAEGTLKLSNSDPANHAVRFEFKGGDREDESDDFTKTLPPGTSLGVEVKADWAGRYARMTCPIHLWMSGYVFFFDHPYFAVTKAGDARLEHVPPGKYHVRVWHEGLGVLYSSTLKFPLPETGTQEVVVGSADATVSFALSGDGKLTAATSP